MPHHTSTLSQDTNCLGAYMHDITKYPCISTDEEARLGRLVKTGTKKEAEEAIQALVCANLRLVVKIAHTFKGHGIDLQDLVAEGNTGLMIAARKFDPDKGAKFSTYSAWWIKQSISKAISWGSRTIRIPSISAHNLQALERAKKLYMADTGIEPDAETLAGITGLSTATINMLNHAATDTVSINETVSEDSDITIESQVSECVDDNEKIKKEEDSIALSSALSSLSQLDRFIVSATYGIGMAVCDLKQIASEVGLDKASIREHLNKALGMLRLAMTTDVKCGHLA